MTIAIFSAGRRMLGLALGMLLLPGLTSADTLQVLWTPNSEPVAGYVVYLGEQPSTSTQRYDVGNTTTFTWPNAVAGRLYCVQVSAYLDSLEGPRSAQTCGYSNQFPALTNPGDRTSVAGSPTSLQLAGSDPDGAPVTYFASGLPAGLSLMMNNGYISGVPAAVGVYSVTASVSDGVLTSTPQVFKWSVSAPSTSDTIAPSIDIKSPTTAATYSSSASTLALSGSAADNVSVVSVSWTNDRGGSGSASGTTSWSAGSIGLKTGTNVITVTARDAAGNQSSKALTVTYKRRRG
jgi:Putative Ig domain/Fibronectin type III domain